MQVEIVFLFYVSETNIDDILRKVFEKLLGPSRDVYRVDGTRKGPNVEIFGALIELKNPRARLSRSQRKGRVFSAVGELMWYLSGSNQVNFIEQYIPKYSKWSDDGGVTANGAYGSRLFLPSTISGISQYQRVIEKLKAKPDSRNAVIQVYSNADAEKESKDIPCTCTIHFAVRQNRLNLHVHMRSNDAFLGLPHDVFAFTMIQEIAARDLGFQLGTYQHSVASLHLYNDSEDASPRTNAQKFLDEGFYEPKAMARMPSGAQWPDIETTVNLEKLLRNGELEVDVPRHLSPYWKDIVNLLRIHAAFKAQKHSLIRTTKQDMNSNVFELYIQDRLERAQGSKQPELALQIPKKDETI
jgi:thymidylate synthase